MIITARQQCRAVFVYFLTTALYNENDNGATQQRQAQQGIAARAAVTATNDSSKRPKNGPIRPNPATHNPPARPYISPDRLIPGRLRIATIERGQNEHRTANRG